MCQLTVISLAFIFICSFIQAAESNDQTISPLDKIESSFLSQIRHHLRNEPQLTRCVRVWQAVESKLAGGSGEDWAAELVSQQVLPAQVDLKTLNELRNVIETRRTGFGQNVLVTFLDDCIEILRENGARELANGEETLKVDDDESKFKNIELFIRELEDQNQKLKRAVEILKEKEGNMRNQVVELVEKLAGKEAELEREKSLVKEAKESELRMRARWEQMKVKFEQKFASTPTGVFFPRRR